MRGKQGWESGKCVNAGDEGTLEEQQIMHAEETGEWKYNQGS
jgi:hypothetical protein